MAFGTANGWNKNLKVNRRNLDRIRDRRKVRADKYNKMSSKDSLITYGKRLKGIPKRTIDAKEYMIVAGLSIIGIVILTVLVALYL